MFALLRHDYRQIDPHLHNDEHERILTTSIPLILAFTITGIMGIVDIIMVGQLSSHSLGGVSLANTVSYTVSMLLRPTLQITGTLGAQALGAGKEQRMRDVFRNGLWLCIVGGLILSVMGLALSYYAVPYAGQDTLVVSEMQAYLDYRIWDIAPMLMLAVLGNYATTLGNNTSMTPVVVFITIANIIFNYMFIFGKWGAPEMGVAGAGLATTAAQFLGVFALMIYLLFATDFRNDFRRLLKRLHRVNMSIQRDILKNGASLCAAGYTDHILFGSISFLSGLISVSALVTQQLVGTIWMIIFMGAYGIGNAIVARVGYHVGAGNTAGILSVVVQGHKFVIFVAVFWIVLLGWAGGNVPHWILPVDEPNLQAIALSYAEVMYLVLVIVLFDCLLGIWIGVSRGLNDTKFFMYGQFVANTIGLIASITAGFAFDMGLLGIIFGVSFAILIALVWNMSRFIYLYNNKKLYDRVVVGND